MTSHPAQSANPRRILLTGSSGHVGIAIAANLARDHDVIGLDLVSGPYTTVVGDMTDPAIINSLVKRVDAIIHCAALHAPHIGSHTADQFIHTNVHSTRLLLDAASRCGIRRFIFTSTTSVYGIGGIPQLPAAVWVTEDQPPRPLDIYDQTKLAAESACREASQAGLPCIILRIGRCFPEPPHLVLSYRLYRGLDVRDAAQAHRLALSADVASFAIFNIAAQTPFLPEDTPQLICDAPAAIRLRCPELAHYFRQRHWPLPSRIDRVYVIEKARQILQYAPIHNVADMLRDHNR